MLPVWGSRAQAQKCSVRDTTQMEILANHFDSRQTRRVTSGAEKIKRDLCVMPDLEVDNSTCVTSSPVTEPQVRPEDTSLAFHGRSRRCDLT